MKTDILQGDVFQLLEGGAIAAGSVDCCVTSPPYWQLRSYLPAGHDLKSLELGSEKSPQDYVANMVRVFRLVREALADHGTCWLNVGDTYSLGKKGAAQGNDEKIEGRRFGVRANENGGSGVDSGNLCLIPWRLALALQEDGWIVRSIVAWTKPAPMPQSVTGWMWRRCRVKVKGCGTIEGRKGSTHENRCAAGKARRTAGVDQAPAQWQDCSGCKKCARTNGYVLRRGSWRPTSSWEPILLLAKTEDYYCDGEAVKTPAAPTTISRDKYTRIIDDPDEQFAVRHDHETNAEAGANLRDVWRQKLEHLSKEELIEIIQDMGCPMPDHMTVSSEPLKEKHYAAFPSNLVSNCLMAGTSSKGYCPSCGMPWVRVVESEYGEPASFKGSSFTAGKTADNMGERCGQGQRAVAKKTTGWRPSCDCSETEPRRGLVLDPFAGSGRTGIAARRLGLDFVGLELNPQYADMARRLLREEMPLFS